MDKQKTYTVLSSVFPYLALKDIMTCRSVCTDWKFVADIFAKLGEVYLHDGAKTTDFISNCEYQELSVSTFAFSSFCYPNFQRGVRYDWGLPQLYSILESDWCQNITTLKLYGLCTVVDAQMKIVSKFNLTKTLGSLPNLAELVVDCSGIQPFPYAMFMVPLAGMSSRLKTISLNRCRVLIPSIEDGDFTRIAPMRLAITDVDFVDEESMMRNVVVNDYVNFELIEEILISGAPVGPYDYPPFAPVNTTLTIHVTSELYNARVISLAGCQFVKKIEIPIKQIVFNDAKIDLNILPWAIEKVYFRHSVEFTNREFSFVNSMPNLNFVAIECLPGSPSAPLESMVAKLESSFNLKSRNIKQTRLESALIPSHVGPFMDDRHRQQFLPDDKGKVFILFKQGRTSPYKLNAGFEGCARNGMFSTK